MKRLSSHKSFGGLQQRYTHASTCCQCPMTFSIYLPPQVQQDGGKDEQWPVLFWLSGLTCTDENFVQKAGAQQYAAQHGMVIVAPDTSPRGEEVADDPAYDLGQGAGFYINAARQPWAAHYRMYDYITEELPALIAREFPVDVARQSIFGHSMGGHGALMIALKNPGRFKSVSAFAPIVTPASVPWGRKVFAEYLGDDEAEWAQWDSTRLVADMDKDMLARLPMRIDQGDGDEFLEPHLKPHLLAEALALRFPTDPNVHPTTSPGGPLALRIHRGYDHSYFFIASFMKEHLEFHAEYLKAQS